MPASIPEGPRRAVDIRPSQQHREVGLIISALEIRKRGLCERQRLPQSMQESRAELDHWARPLCTAAEQAGEQGARQPEAGKRQKQDPGPAHIPSLGLAAAQGPRGCPRADGYAGRGRAAPRRARPSFDQGGGTKGFHGV